MLDRQLLPYSHFKGLREHGIDSQLIPFRNPLCGLKRGVGAMDLARKAVAEDPDCVECRGVLGYMLATRLWDWEQGERHLMEAAKSARASAQIRIWYAKLLAITWRFTEAHRKIDLAEATEPANSRALVIRGLTYYFQRDCGKAEIELHQAASLDT